MTDRYTGSHHRTVHRSLQRSHNRSLLPRYLLAEVETEVEAEIEVEVEILFPGSSCGRDRQFRFESSPKQREGSRRIESKQR